MMIDIYASAETNVRESEQAKSAVHSKNAMVTADELAPLKVRIAAVTEVEEAAKKNDPKHADDIAALADRVREKLRAGDVPGAAGEVYSEEVRQLLDEEKGAIEVFPKGV